MIHLASLVLKFHDFDSKNASLTESESVFKIKEIRTVGTKNGFKNNQVFLAPKKAQVDPFKAQALLDQIKKVEKISKTPRRLMLPSKPTSAIDIVTKAEPTQSVAQVMEQMPTSYAGVVNSSPTLSKTDVNVRVEMPEGVKEDELNEFELMFYTFQKRMMTKYVESIILQVREFEKTHPHRKIFPEGKHIMTGRVVFDKDGNIKQIKMVRWTNVADLQGVFEEALKSMYSLPNPPKFLWEKNGEFTVFYNFVVNNI